MTKPLLILIAGPYRSGTGDDPDLLARNLARLEEAAWPIFKAGHLPMISRPRSVEHLIVLAARSTS